MNISLRFSSCEYFIPSALCMYVYMCMHVCTHSQGHPQHLMDHPSVSYIMALTSKYFSMYQKYSLT